MKFRSLRYIFILLLWGLGPIPRPALIAQSLQLVDSLDFRTPLFEIDALDQLYVINENNRFEKRDKKGQLLFYYENNTLGTIYSIDVSNPFKILLFYKDFQTIIILDRTLNSVSTINLLDLGITQAEVVSSAEDNRIWLYDSGDFKLKQLDESGRLIRLSEDLTFTIPEFQTPIRLKYQAKRLLAQLPDFSFLVFDAFGQFRKKIPLQAACFDLSPNGFLFFQDKHLFLLDERSMLEKEIFNSPIAIQQFRFRNKLLWILNEEKIYLFKV